MHTTSHQQVDFLTYIGEALTLGKPIAAAISGTSSQTMVVYSSALEMLEPFVGSQVSVDNLADAIVRATYEAINATWSATGDGSAALKDASSLSNLYCSSYAASMPVRRRQMRRLQAVSRSVEDLKPLCDGIGKVVAGTNAHLQEIVDQAKSAAESAVDFDGVNALVQVTAISAVQLSEMLSSIAALSARVAADPSLDIPMEVALLDKVRLFGVGRVCAW